MSNVLPREIKKQNQREYALRFWSLVFLTISMLLVFAGILLIPSYLISVTEEESKIEQIKLVRSYNASKASDVNEQTIDLVKNQLALFDIKRDEIELESVLGEILNAHDSVGGISLTEVLYETNFDSIESPNRLSLRGVAHTREDLLDFSQNLEKQDLFGNVDLPVSSLRNERDLNFSLIVEVLK